MCARRNWHLAKLTPWVGDATTGIQIESFFSPSVIPYVSKDAEEQFNLERHFLEDRGETSIFVSCKRFLQFRLVRSTVKVGDCKAKRATIIQCTLQKVNEFVIDKKRDIGFRTRRIVLYLCWFSSQKFYRILWPIRVGVDRSARDFEESFP